MIATDPKVEVGRILGRAEMLERSGWGALCHAEQDLRAELKAYRKRSKDEPDHVGYRGVILGLQFALHTIRVRRLGTNGRAK